MRSRIRTALSLFAAVVIGTTLGAVPAYAQDEPLNQDIYLSMGPDIGGQPGTMFYLHQEVPCPAVPSGVDHQEIHVRVVDAAGVETNYGTVGRTNADGTWADTEWRHIPYRTIMADVDPPVYTEDAAPGFANIYASCVLSDGTITQRYWPAAFNVGSIYVGNTSWPFQVTTPNVEPAGTIQLESNNEDSTNYKYRCWTGVDGTIVGHGYTVPFTGTVYGSGTWAASAAAAAEVSGTMVPLPPGKYTVKANCQAQYYPGQYQFSYADQLLTVGDTAPPAGNCKDVLIIGLVGSGQGFNGKENTSVSPEVQTAIEGFKQKLKAGKSHRVEMLDYPALPVETIGKYFPNIERGMREYIEGKNAGVRKLRNLVADQMTKCAGQIIVPVGYSQGALVAHEYMVEHARNYNGAKKQIIGAAVTIADAAQTKNSGVLNFGDAPQNAMGICQYLSVKCFKTETFGDIPGAYKGRTVTVCDKKDIVCDHLRMASTPLPGMGVPGGIAVHKEYANDPNVTLAGKWAAQRVNARWN